MVFIVVLLAGEQLAGIIDVIEIQVQGRRCRVLEMGNILPLFAVNRVTVDGAPVVAGYLADVKYLKLALQKLQGYKDISSRIEFYDIEHAKNTGDGELAKIFDYLQKGNDTNIKICMFDRDNPTYIFSDTFLRGNNQVYKFNLCTPQHRSKTDLISVEHCLTDSELKTVDANGRRIFLAGEFSKITRITADEQYVCHHKIGSNPLEILDGSNDKKVYKISANDESNYALTKDDFVQHIIDNDPGFDKFSFDGFRPTLDTIKAIIQDAERMNTVS